MYVIVFVCKCHIRFFHIILIIQKYTVTTICYKRLNFKNYFVVLPALAYNIYKLYSLGLNIENMVPNI